ncbi:hypothetical protein DL93DRAFT_1649991 [Clavulina sp. PMI_390]|nr:hypothetical protein DL93DRAFT_1649991 [Clavulina sp. PMI_390]
MRARKQLQALHAGRATQAGTPNDEMDTALRDSRQAISMLDITYNFPSELLSSIFEFACSDVSEGVFSLNKRKPMDPLRQVRASIASTCSRWREIVLTSPRLWSNIALHISPNISFPKCLEIISLEVSRSGACLLTLRIDVSFSSTSSDWDGWELSNTSSSSSSDWTNLRSLFTSVSSRIEVHRFESWSSINPSGMHPLGFVLDPAARFPNMRIFHYQNSPSQSEPILIDLRRIPHVQVLEIYDSVSVPIQFRLPPSLEVRRCHLGGGNVPGVFDMLALTRNTLEILRLDAYVPSTTLTSKIVFPRLREFLWSGNLPQLTMQNMVAPALEYLNFESLGWDRSPDRSGLSDVRTVVVDYMERTCIQRFFDLHPKIQRLSVNEWSVQSIVTIWKDSPLQILADLQVFHVVDAYNLDEDTFYEILAINRQRSRPFVLEVDSIDESLDSICQDFGPFLCIADRYPAWRNMSQSAI